MPKIEDLKDIEAGDLILVSGRGVYSKGIQWFRDSKYNHVAIALDNNLLIEARWTVEINPISNYNEFDVYRLKGGLTNKEKEKMEEYLLRMHGTKYDVPQIVGFIWQAVFGGENLFNSPKYVICSELADYAYWMLGYDLEPDVRKGDAAPDHIAESKELELVYSFM